MQPIDTYDQAEAFLFGRVNYERTAPANGDFKLDRMRALLSRLGDPQQRMPAVHVAGTKGKGSTSAMCASILRAAGLRVGLYTSPHMVRFEERMTVDDRPPDADQVIGLARRVRDATGELDPKFGPATFFEVVTAMGWLHFAESDVDVVALEVGLGGRLDSTNVCRPEVCVITSISRDHTTLLGTTLDSIAREKAGIAKPGVPLISGATAPEASEAIRTICRERNTPVFELDREIRCRPRDAGTDGGERPFPMRRVDVTTPWRTHHDLSIGLAGAHQARNAALATAACDALSARGWSIPPEAIREGLRTVVWPLRIEVARRRPLVILDAAHNWASVGALLRTLDDDFPMARRTLIFAGTRDKDVTGLLRRLLPRFDRTILTQYVGNPRNVPARSLRRVAESLGHPRCATARSPAEAWALASRLVEPDELVCVTGSFFLAAEMRELLAVESGAETPSKV